MENSSKHSKLNSCVGLIPRSFAAIGIFIASNAQLFQRIEQKLLEHDNEFERIFQLIEDKELKPEKGSIAKGGIFLSRLY
jgi:hypothetical protein